MLKNSLLLLPLALGLAACGDDDVMPMPDMGMDASEPGVQAIFAPVADPMPWGVAPFPDDLYLDEGRVALGSYPSEEDAPFPGYTEALLEGFGDLDGFGGVTPVFVPIDGDLDPSSLPEDAAASMGEDASCYLLDADPGSPTAFTRVPAEVLWLADEQMIAIRPADGSPLHGGSRYAAIVTTSVLDTDGRALGPADALIEVLAEDAPTDALLLEAREQYMPVVESADIETAQVAAIAVFTVQSVEDDLVRVREQLLENAPPAVTILEVISSGEALDARLGEPVGGQRGLGIEGGVSHANIGWLIHGTIEVPSYLNETPGVHGVFSRTETGMEIRRMEPASFSLVLPVDAAETPPRLVLFQHGITAERSDMVGIADSLAEAGYATLAIDAPYHGLRTTMRNPDTRNRFTGEETPDGFGDIGGAAVIVDFAGLQDNRGELFEFHPLYFRDALRQSAADLLAVVRAVRSTQFEGIAGDETLAEFRFSPTPLAFIGNSLGGIIGSMFVAVEPEIGSAVLAVTGGNLTLLVQQSPSFNPAYIPQLFPLLGLDDGDIDYATKPPIYYPELALWQMQMGRGDSGLYGDVLAEGDANIFMLMSKNDETVHNVNTESLAGAIGVPAAGDAMPAHVELEVAELPLRGNVAREEGALTRGLYIHEPGSHGLVLYPNGQASYEHPVEPPFAELSSQAAVPNPVDAVQAQIVAFLESWRAGSAEISAPE